MSYIPFKNFCDFKSTCLCDLGDVVTFRDKSNHELVVNAVITCETYKCVGLGTSIFTYDQLFDDFEFFDHTSEKWVPFGSYFEDVKKDTSSKKKFFKFKAGTEKGYINRLNHKIYYIADKYKNPLDGKRYAVFVHASKEDGDDILVLPVIRGVFVESAKDADTQIFCSGLVAS